MVTASEEVTRALRDVFVGTEDLGRLDCAVLRRLLDQGRRRRRRERNARRLAVALLVTALAARQGRTGPRPRACTRAGRARRESTGAEPGDRR